MVEKECKRCKGSGHIFQLSDNYLAKPKRKICPECGGSGYILHMVKNEIQKRNNDD